MFVHRTFCWRCRLYPQSICTIGYILIQFLLCDKLLWLYCMDYIQSEYILEPCPIKDLSHYFFYLPSCDPSTHFFTRIQKLMAGWQNILTQDYAMVLFINLSECVLLRCNTMHSNKRFSRRTTYLFSR